MSRRSLIVAVLTAFASLPCVSLAGLAPGDGWRASVVTAAPGGAFVGGMDFLPNGNLAIFDGNAIVEVDATSGAVLATLHAPGAVFGSFVKVDPSGTFLLFGESSNQTITKVPLDGSPATLVATVLFNFDLVFASSTIAYLTAATGTFGTADIFRLDVASGALDPIALMDGPSGPIARDAFGNLYYGESTLTFPAPTGQQRVLRFTAAQVAAAVGPGHLTTAQAHAFITGLTSPAGIAIDDEGDLFVSDSGDGFVRQYASDGALKDAVGAEAPFVFVSTLALSGSAVPGRFDAYQPESAGTLAVLSTDFFSFNDVTLVTPRRPTLDVQPANPVPDGALHIQVASAPPSGLLVLLLSGATEVAPEVLVNTQGASFFFGVDLGAPLLTLLAPLDAQGAFAANAHNGPADQGAFVMQAIAVDALGRGVGTTPARTVILQ